MDNGATLPGSTCGSATCLFCDLGQGVILVSNRLAEEYMPSLWFYMFSCCCEFIIFTFQESVFLLYLL